MKNTFKATLAAVLLSSVAAAPLATLTVVATTDAAYAKSDKAGGNGGGKSQSGGNSKSAKSAAGGSSMGKSGTKTASSGGGKSLKAAGSAVEGVLRKLTGQEKKAQRTVKASASAKVAKGSGMHPSELGKMNGALNANVNALIAHVRNGNFNGPIGGMAGLAVASRAAAGADAIIELDGKFADLDKLLIDNGYVDDEGNPDIARYLAAIQDVPGNDSVGLIEDAITAGDETAIADALLEINNGVRDFASVEEYEAWRDGVEGDEPIPEADALIAELDGLERPDETEVAEAETLVGARTDAEDYMLSIWNKGDGDDAMRSESEAALLEKLYQRIDADGAALADAIDATLPDESATEGEEAVESSSECLPDEDCAAVEEEVVVVAE